MAEYNVVFSMLESIQDEMKTLSSKKPDMLLTTLKVKMINKLIGSAKELLASEPTLEYLVELDEEKLPQYSDVVIILRLYIEALVELKPDNIRGKPDISTFSIEDLEIIEQIFSKYQNKSKTD